MLAFFHVILFIALAGRAIAFTNITVGAMNVSTSDIVNIPDSPVKTACSTDCTGAASKIQACNGSAACLCNNVTVASLLQCEQCMFSFLVTNNKPMPDFRAGSTPVLGAYASACNASAQPLPKPAQLALPQNWDGPFVAVLPFPGALATAFVGGFLGVSAILLLSNM